jgi:hypothetical protein
MKAQKPSVKYSTDLVFAAAAAAYRINNYKYETNVAHSGSCVTIWPNKTVLRRVIQDSNEITDVDRELGTKIREHLKTYLFKIVAGVQLNNFDSTALSLANVEEISERDLGYVAYYPVTYERAEKQRSVDERIFNCRAEYAGKIGEKIETTAEIVKSGYSTQWDTFYVTAITLDNQAIRFGIKSRLEVGSRVTLTGKVKDHCDGYMTKLNYVKLITK